MSVLRDQGMYAVKGQMCSRLFPRKKGPYKRCLHISNVCCRVMNIDLSADGVGVGTKARSDMALPFAAVRGTCGFKGHVSLIYVAMGPNIAIADVTSGVRRMVGGTRCVRPSSGRTIVVIGTRTVFDVVSGLFAKVGVLT